MRGDVGRVAVGERGRLERAARLVEGAPQRADRGRAAGGGADAVAAAAAGERLARPARGADRVASPASTTAQSSGRPAAALVATSAGHAGVGERGLERALGRRRVVELEDEDRRLAADPERPQPAAQLLGLEAVAERVGEQVAGEPALGLAHDPLAHQLEPDDDRGLARDQPLEVAERRAVADHGQPGDRRAARAGRARARTARARRAPRSAGRERRPAAPSPERATISAASAAVASAVGAAVAADGGRARGRSRRGPARRRRSPLAVAAMISLEAVALDHQPLEPLVDLGAALEHVELLVDEPRGGALGDRDERHLVGDLEQRQLVLAGRLDDRLRHPLVVEADAEAEPGEALVGEQLDVAALLRRRRRGCSRWSAAARRPRATGSGPRARRCGPSAPRLPAPTSPAASSSPQSATRLPTVSIRARAASAATSPDSAARHRRAAGPAPHASSSTGRRTSSISSNCSVSQISGGASWITGSPRSSARQISPRR